MNSRAFEAAARRLQGALNELRTEDAAAVRKWDDHDAGFEDGWQSPFLSPFKIDELKVMTSPAFRRLSNKAQSRVGSPNAHQRRREVHSMEVAKHAYLMARILGLNAELAYVGGLAHDLGHTPFGHRGEKYLADKSDRNFCHNVFGCIVVQFIERGGRGLNLTHQTIQCIRDHSDRGDSLPFSDMSPEARLVRLSDKISNVGSDFSDFLNGRLEGGPKEHPEIAKKITRFGGNQWDITTSVMLGLMKESADAGEVSFSVSDAAKQFWGVHKTLRGLMEEIMPQTGHEPFLDLVFEGVRAHFPDIDPVLAVGCMVDSEVRFLIDSLWAKDYLTEEDFSKVSLADIMSSLEKIGRGLDWTVSHLDW